MRVERAEVPSITLTAAAIDQVKFLMRKKGGETLGLRLGVRGGGCSGLSYVMRLEETPGESDFVLEQGGIRIFIDPKSARFLDGVVLDYSLTNLLEGGWKWINPNAVRSCGCGTSFTPK
ncbi:MAG: iron-sulfur cluster assembly accessory protein [Chloroherpetonaceae bacterium]|nr:iron-sulfur cluster assembly accessory protein [Chthonomonadaceae bacterium]MDW8208614.1 iron-sulfur cluster assembly accessory protein [Chloroherpetonaceae bacterium]